MVPCDCCSCVTHSCGSDLDHCFVPLEIGASTPFKQCAEDLLEPRPGRLQDEHFASLHCWIGCSCACLDKIGMVDST